MTMMTWVFAVVVAEASAGPFEKIGQPGGVSQSVVVPLSGKPMTCTREGDHLVCVLPLNNAQTTAAPAAPSPDAIEPAPPVAHAMAAVAPFPKAAKRSRPAPVLPGPEVSAQLKAAEANIALAKSLLPRAKTPEEAVLAQQMLYWANEQHRTVSALLHTADTDLSQAPDPFDNDREDKAKQAGDASPVVLCQGETKACNPSSAERGTP